jgi:hypothetical protein
MGKYIGGKVGWELFRQKVCGKQYSARNWKNSGAGAPPTGFRSLVQGKIKR